MGTTSQARGAQQAGRVVLNRLGAGRDAGGGGGPAAQNFFLTCGGDPWCNYSQSSLSFLLYYFFSFLEKKKNR